MAIEGLKKHQGVLDNTGRRVAVVFRKLPTDDNFCLIVETETLPDSYHDYVVQTLGSREALETNEFYEVLNRRTFPDGTNCLASLHHRGFLRKEPVSNVTMIPLPGQKVPLGLINATIDKKVDEWKSKQNTAPEESKSVADTVAAARAAGQDPASIARGLILQAEVLELDASVKREEAYAMAPELKPGKGRPADPEDIKAEKAQQRKDSRRERDRAKAEELRKAKQKDALSDKVAAKLARDSLRSQNLS